MTLIFKIHYFLFYGALSTIFGYEMVYARQYTNSTTVQFGYLNMILPFITVLTTPMICSMADRNRCHRTYFTMSLLITTITLCLYALLPLIMHTPAFTSKDSQRIRNGDQGHQLQVGPWIYFCLTSLVCDLSMGVNTCLSDSFAVLQAEEKGTSFGKIIVWGTFGWASTALALCAINQWTMFPRLMPGILFGAILLAVDVIIVSFWRNAADFKLDFIPPSAAQTLTGSASPAHKDPSDYMPMNESAKINLGTDEREGIRYRKTRSPIEMLKDHDPMARAPETVTIIVKKPKKLEADLQEEKGENSSAATPASEIEKEDEDEDSIGLKTVSSGYSRLDKVTNNSKVSVKHSGSLMTQLGSETLLSLDNSQELKKQRELEEKDRNFASLRMQLILLGLILKKRTSLIRYLILFVLSGFFMSMHWNYFFLYLEEIYSSEFELISAISMISQSILGELPFFILSRKFIQFFGKSHSLSISIISIGFRFLLYRFFLPNVNMYFIFITDSFQGPNYGLFYVIMTEIGLEYSFCDDDTIENLIARGEINRDNRHQVDTIRLSLRSTVQSVAFACYEGLGVGFGSLIGGFIVHSYGFEVLWLSMAIASILIGVLNLLIDLIYKDDDEDDQDGLGPANADQNAKEKSERREFLEAQKKGTLKKVAKPRPFPPAAPPLNSVNMQRSIKLKMLLKNVDGGGKWGSPLVPPEAPPGGQRRT